MILVVLENEDRILNYIKEHPGCYLRKMKNDLKLSMGSTQYHVNRLLKSGKVTSIRKGLRKFYFMNGILFGPNVISILQILSQETARAILLYIIEKKNLTQSDLIKLLGVSGATVNWHIKRLLDFGLISERKSGKYKIYDLDVDREGLINIIRNCNPGVWDLWGSRLTDISFSFEE